ncbi:hypothetical protein SAMN05428988_4112 [Chitinophaga sp. YR573]|uniref:hypothetical protein n=1 Tax=Chitinophaga sp. YR573 TaxID=1881040 RepID=UPI0008AE43F1|nr:hypothetical protein [Chitinophaga sp. YR573]SEW34339.1 hypothetical protein SAMN05428988_4112 [Chitinophaga sp. YR573]
MSELTRTIKEAVKTAHTFTDSIEGTGLKSISRQAIMENSKLVLMVFGKGCLYYRKERK